MIVSVNYSITISFFQTKIMAEGEEYSFVLRYLIRDCGQRTFRSIIENELQGTSLEDFLNDPENEQKNRTLHEMHVITEEDFNLLYPDDESPSLDGACFTLLYVLMRTFFCTLSWDDPMWNKGSKPMVNDLSRPADVIRLRNNILEVHISSTIN